MPTTQPEPPAAKPAKQSPWRSSFAEWALDFWRDSMAARLGVTVEMQVLQHEDVRLNNYFSDPALRSTLAMDLVGVEPHVRVDVRQSIDTFLSPINRLLAAIDERQEELDVDDEGKVQTLDVVRLGTSADSLTRHLLNDLRVAVRISRAGLPERYFSDPQITIPNDTLSASVSPIEISPEAQIAFGNVTHLIDVYSRDAAGKLIEGVSAGDSDELLVRLYGLIEGEMQKVRSQAPGKSVVEHNLEQSLRQSAPDRPRRRTPIRSTIFRLTGFLIVDSAVKEVLPGPAGVATGWVAGVAAVVAPDVIRHRSRRRKAEEFVSTEFKRRSAEQARQLMPYYGKYLESTLELTARAMTQQCAANEELLNDLPTRNLPEGQRASARVVAWGSVKQADPLTYGVLALAEGYARDWQNVAASELASSPQIREMARHLTPPHQSPQPTPVSLSKLKAPEL